MAIDTRISEETYQQIVLSDPDHKWELIEGRLREKPGMTWEHNAVVSLLSFLLQSQLDPRRYHVFFEGRVRLSTATIFIPDLAVIPASFGQEFRDQPGRLAIFNQPLPLVIEVWSRSTGDYDVDVKIPEYQRRGDLEIWFIHPYERTLTAWRRRPDGSYEETAFGEGSVSLVALPSVVIELQALFDR